MGLLLDVTSRSRYFYDATGNLLSGAGRIVAWNVENKPVCIATASGSCQAAANMTTFVYDGDGGRVKKIVGTTTTRYLSKLYECDTTGGTTSCSRFIWAGDTRIAIMPDSATAQNCNPACYFHADHLGSSNVITGPTGTVVETMTYYPYGEVKSDLPGTPVNVPYKYTGKERDSSTGLMYYEARYYDPKLGRFISADTIIPNVRDPQDLNRYTYASNNPFRYTDPTGHFSLKIGKFLNRVFHNPIVRVAAWYFFPLQMMYLDPTTRQYTLPVAAGVIGTFACGGNPVCGGALAGAVSGYVSGRDIGRSTWMGAVSGAVTWGVGAGFNVGGLGDYVVAQAFVAGAASGATEAALGGGDVLQAALIGGSVGAVSAYMQTRGMSPAAAQEKAMNAKMSSDLTVDTPILGRKTGEYYEGVFGKFTKSPSGSGGILSMGREPNWTSYPSVDVELYWHPTDSGPIRWKSPAPFAGHEHLGSFSLAGKSMQHVLVPYSDGTYKLFVPPWNITPSDNLGGGTYSITIPPSK